MLPLNRVKLVCSGTYGVCFWGQKWARQMSGSKKCHPKSKVKQLCFRHIPGWTNLSMWGSEI